MGLTENHASKLFPENSRTLILDAYQKSVADGELKPDPFQQIIIKELQQVYENLQKPGPALNRSRFGGLFSVSSKRKSKYPQPQPTGLYLWGGVGRGKTHLVDFFYELLPTEKKQRLHFHRFMQLVHEQLGELDGEADPLKVVAESIANESRILCLDEMHVSDITDAMILGRLFEHLFSRGVILVTTSNIKPRDLYKNGLQREHFLPTIDLLEKHTRVVEIEGELDYRLRLLEENGVYHISAGELSEQRLENYFHKLAAVELHKDRKDIIINHRRIPVKMWSDCVVWFSFNDLCDSPRSADDYNQIATFFHTIMISDIPVMDSSRDDAARRFTILIDQLYDCRVNLVVSAEAEPEQLYTSGRLDFEFQRTASRLREMQSTEYMTHKESWCP